MDDLMNEVEVVERYEISDDEEDDATTPAPPTRASWTPRRRRTTTTTRTPRRWRACRRWTRRSPARRPSHHGHGEDRVLTQVRPEVVDDFIRNFLIKVGMTDPTASGTSSRPRASSPRSTSTVPDIYLRNQELDEKVVGLQRQLDKMREITAQGTWDKFRKERDFHRMHHRRVVQEKEKLTSDLQRLRKHASYEPTLKDLQRKYEVAMKEKMLTRLERDRIKARVHTLEAQIKQLQDERAGSKQAAPPKPLLPEGADSRLPQPYSNNICTASGDKTVSIWDARSALCVQTFYGHTNAATGRRVIQRRFNACNSVAINNRGDVIASCDADGAIKLWDVRTVTEIGTIQVSQHPCNKVGFDRSATRIACASDDGLLRLLHRGPEPAVLERPATRTPSNPPRP
ncbi:hypothetical protein JL720_10170 [Aureococcus anophagefferens]|nr:hypothetical protein JL720_10170 [Aureococcus anophagefferens]